MKERIVVALGGNALGNTPTEQQKALERVAKTIAELIREGKEIILTHGNGPQVGMIHLAFEESHALQSHIPQMPLAEATAMSEGYIGYHLQKALIRELEAQKLDTGAVSLVTQVEVSPDDAAFHRPSKPIGTFYSEQEAARFTAEHPEYTLKEDAGRGFRRVVASPRPRHIVEIDAIRALSRAGLVVVACGGGGIPVIRDSDGSLRGVEAVIDKDFAAERLAEELDADTLLILTAVEQVMLYYGTSAEKPLDTVSAAEARRYCEEGHFASGSMLPKVEAAIAFAESREGRRAIIAALENAAAGVRGASGTVIEKHPELTPVG